MRYARDRGLALRRLDRRQDSTLAAIGLLWAGRQSAAAARRYVERVFERYWRGELDIENIQAIRALLGEAGAPVAGFEEFVSREGRSELERGQAELRDMGVFEVPTYIVNGDIYLGRQHLPILRAYFEAGSHPGR